MAARDANGATGWPRRSTTSTAEVGLVERNHSGELELTKSYEALFAVIHARAPIDRGHGLAAPSESGLKGDACTTTFVAPPSRDRGRNSDFRGRPRRS